MKKLQIISVCLLATLGTTAQENVLKEAERAMKGGSTFDEVVTIVTPAFTDAETKDNARTYYIPGKSAYNEYNDLLGLKAFNKLPEGGEAIMVRDLLEGYKYFMKALPLDSVADSKGKIKTKYSKDIVNVICGHHTDYNNMAIAAWGLKDYKGAYDAWEIYLTLPENPVFADKLTAQPDTIIAEVMYNQALAAWQFDDLKLALKAFMKARKAGYQKKNLYDYAIAVAYTAKENEALVEFASEAHELYGKEDTQYIGQIINYYLQNKDYDKCFSLINDAIATDSNNAQYFVVRGVLNDQISKYSEAKADFKKAIELNPENDQAQYNYGRELCEEAYRLSDTAPTSPAESVQFFESNVKPLFIEAAEYLEKASAINPENRDALRYLENVYYNLKDEQKLKDVERRMNN